MTSTVHFSRFMTAKWLNDNSAVQWNCEHMLESRTRLRIHQDGVNYERIFRLKLVDKSELRHIDDLEVYIEPGLEYTGEPIPPPPPVPPPNPPPPRRTDPISWTISNGDEHVIGMQLRDIIDYRNSALGPYQGIEGKPGRVLDNVAVLPDSTQVAVNRHWPRYFRITLKPMEKVGFCSSPVDDGYLLTVSYDEFNPTIDGSQDLWLDVYRFEKIEEYLIHYVKVVVTSFKH